MATTIQVSEKLAKSLKQRKLYEKESYEEVIWDLLEDSQELSVQVQRDIATARKEIAAGKSHSHAQVRKTLGL